MSWQPSVEADLPAVHLEWLLAKVSLGRCDSEKLDWPWRELVWKVRSDLPPKAAKSDLAQRLAAAIARWPSYPTLHNRCVFSDRHEVKIANRWKRRATYEKHLAQAEAYARNERVIYRRFVMPAAIRAAGPAERVAYWVGDCHRCRAVFYLVEEAA